MDQGTNPKTLVGRTKPSMFSLPLRVMLGIGDVMRQGAAEYGLFNWRDSRIPVSIYMDAISRHLEEWQEGKDVDAKSGRHPLEHVAANCIIILDAIKQGTLIDDRWKPQPVKAEVNVRRAPQDQSSVFPTGSALVGLAFEQPLPPKHRP